MEGNFTTKFRESITTLRLAFPFHLKLDHNLAFLGTLKLGLSADRYGIQAALQIPAITPLILAAMSMTLRTPLSRSMGCVPANNLPIKY